MDRSELARRLRSRRALITEELGRNIHHIEELEATLQALEGSEVTAQLFPPQNPFRDVPIRRINTETYILIARQIVGGQPSVQTRTPGSEKPALLQELELRRREVRRIIASLDRQIEQLEAQGAEEGNLDSYPGARRIFSDRDNLRAELQFYIDLTEALNYTPTRTTPEERAAANQRARTWVENIGRRRNNRA
jgi:hypothetical protein